MQAFVPTSARLRRFMFAFVRLQHFVPASARLPQFLPNPTTRHAMRQSYTL
jgi:hypothetical protein